MRHHFLSERDVLMRTDSSDVGRRCVAERHLQRGSVPDQEADLQVHHVQVRLQLVVEADAPHHLLPQAQLLRLLSDVNVAQVEQVNKLPDHG